MSGQQKELEISLREHRPVSMIYMKRDGEISQRVVQVTGWVDGGLQAYCYKRKGPRTFRSDQILAVSLKVPRSHMSAPAASRRTALYG